MNAQQILNAYRGGDEWKRLNLYFGYRELRPEFTHIDGSTAVASVNPDPLFLLRLSFLVGAIADFAVGVNWLLISLGADVPNLISYYRGSGADYFFAMYISTMFMFGWTALFVWGYRSPLERRGLLVITAALLSTSIVVELLFFRATLQGAGFLSGLVFRMLIVGKFTFSYLNSLRMSEKMSVIRTDSGK